jgi:hypothetical protein
LDVLIFPIKANPEKTAGLPKGNIFGLRGFSVFWANYINEGIL